MDLGDYLHVFFVILIVLTSLALSIGLVVALWAIIFKFLI